MKMDLSAEQDYCKRDNRCKTFAIILAAEHSADAAPGGETPEKKERIH
jgi:hypothetical protein